jgi:hypothetical protein
MSKPVWEMTDKEVALSIIKREAPKLSEEDAKYIAWQIQERLKETKE